MASEYEKFLRFIVPEPCVILGVELQPLTLGHLLHLERFGLPTPTRPDEIALAVVICSRPVDDILPTINDPWLGFKMRLWLWRVAPFSAIDWPAKAAAFEDYVEEHLNAPTAISTADKSARDSLRDSGTPFLQHLKVTLQHGLNYTHAEAMALPYCQAMWDFYTYHEMQGNVVICDREHRAAMKKQADDQHSDAVAEAIRMQREAGILN